MPRKNRRENKRTRRRHQARDADAGIRTDNSIDPEKERRARELLPAPVDEADAGPGAILRSRSDARMVAQYASLGVIDEETATAVVKRCYTWIAKAKDGREYSRLMKLIIAIRTGMAQEALQRAQLEKVKMLGSPLPVRPEPYIEEDQEPTDDEQPVQIAFLEGASDDELLETARILHECGQLDRWAQLANDTGNNHGPDE